jgi:uncharacterized protein (DUF2236 family)
MIVAPVQHRITREIWGSTDALLLIFGGAAAEFAVNRAVDWLFFTAALPGDPIRRLFRTVHYAQRIAFADPTSAHATLEQIRRVHAAVERARGQTIPPWAHRAVLYMLVDYSERAFQVLGRPLRPAAQEELFADFRRIGLGLGIAELPPDYPAWCVDRRRRLSEDLAWTPSTAALYAAYRRHLGPWRYGLLRQLQGLLVPPRVRELLQLPGPHGGRRLMRGFRALRLLKLAAPLRQLVIPMRHWDDLKTLEHSQPSAPLTAA